MKGMQKIRRGKSFAGVVLYTLKPGSHHKNDPIVIGGNVTIVGNAAKDLIAEFDSTKQLRPDVQKAVWHNSLRLPKNEALTDAQWAEIADDYMSRMGFSETHLRCYVLHDDKAGQHIHIIASRIELSSGKLYLGKNENLISTRIIQQLELDYSLTRTKGPEAKAPPASPSPEPKHKKSRNEAMMEERIGELCPKTIIQNALEVFLANKPSTTEFVHQLVAQNIRAIPNIASTGRMNGFSFEYQGIVFKASQLGKGYSWAELQNKIDYQAERDNAFLFELKASVNEDSEIVIPTETITEDVNKAIEVIIPVNSTGLGEECLHEADESPQGLLRVEIISGSIATEEAAAALLSEACGGTKEVYATEAVKEARNNQSLPMVQTGFRWLETIPYLDIFMRILKKLKIPFLKPPVKHKTITCVKVVETFPSRPKNYIETPSFRRKATHSM
ncbi:relaxase [Serratia sp. OLHL2]|uniref:relaxase/mobilization nuclease domain-containing protein n=1 Tax=Enterobacterales TaxID=91347 RepID=UPI000C1A849C|nr:MULTISPECIES: relaxase/mobilization nuclease domain-containing protein [unclassified Serratia (in: enterobacteria)]EDW1729345.1 relaxase/mobilization nuclease domain-containing protein [Salmonella enterica subsp. enterica]EGG7184521.1 relaxase/mobilization nuclease domain-containing protein [Salmonella enterica]MEC5349397.1 relaxase/mobilization nuclease domain-containing protein [Serratia liquefaciens]PII49356.1 relaxase [Serratia sp. OLBL1]PII50157.1 relaxase [Serratia sp. OLCL1]